MSFYDHLDELRTRLMRCLWGFMGGFVACYFVAEPILAFLRRPLFEALPPRAAQTVFYESF